MDNFTLKLNSNLYNQNNGDVHKLKSDKKLKELVKKLNELKFTLEKNLAA